MSDSEYEIIVERSERVAWRVDDVIGSGERLDFHKPFLPETLAGAQHVVGLTDPERLKLNQIRAYSYLHIFTFVEEYIIATALRLANGEVFGDPWAVRALMRFGDEELKHQQLFRRFQAAFRHDFGTRCDGVGSPEEAAGFILSKSPLAVMLATLHLELVTQAHYTDSVRLGAADNEIDQLFASMLKHHWVEEAQHASIDLLEIRKLAAGASRDVIDRSIDDYVAILHALDGVLDRERAIELENLERALGRELEEPTRLSFDAHVRAAARNAFFVRGLTHRAFREELARLASDAPERVDAATLELRGS